MTYTPSTKTGPYASTPYVIKNNSNATDYVTYVDLIDMGTITNFGVNLKTLTGNDSASTWHNTDIKKWDVLFTAIDAHLTGFMNAITNLSNRINALTPDKPTQVTISPSSLNLYAGGSQYNLTATVLPATASQNVTWSSSDESKATVNQSGTVTTASNSGSVTITATASNGIKGTCTIQVLAVTLDSITWTGGRVSANSISSGETITLTKGTVTANYSGRDAVNVTNDSGTRFIVNNGASISGTTITAPTVTSDTVCTISVQYGGKTASTTVQFTVTPPVQESDYYLYVGHQDPNTLDLDNIITGSFDNFEMNVGWVNLTEAGISIDDNTRFDIYVEGPTSGKWYVAIPKPFVSTDSNYNTVAAGLEKMTNNVITVKGHEYNVFTRSGESKHTSMWFTSINNVTDSNHIFS